MKRIKKLFILLFVLLPVGCTSNENTATYDSFEETLIEENHEYSEVSDYKLVWESMFDVNLNEYYVYIYSTSCAHCSSIKNYVITKALEKGNIFFIKGTNKDQITNDSKNIKFAENPEDIWILGYPSLLFIKSGKCTKNLAGVDQIKLELK